MSLASRFRAELARAVEGDVDRALDSALDRAHAAWPDIPLPPEIFVAFLAGKVQNKPDVEAALAKLRIEDLYLACACLEGDSTALGHFETMFMREAELAVTRLGGTALTEDVRHSLYADLLIGSGRTAPKLAQYGGKGDLKSFIRVAAVRRGQDLLRKDKRVRHMKDEDMMDLTAPEDDQEITYLKRMYRSEFKAAFAEAMGTLSTRERNLLRLQVLDGLTADQIASIHQVHRITVVRWQGKVRAKLFSTTRNVLMKRLRIDQRQFESISRMVRSQLDVSLMRHLGRASQAV